MNIQTAVFCLLLMTICSSVCDSNYKNVHTVTCCRRDESYSNQCLQDIHLSLKINLHDGLPSNSVLQLTNGTCYLTHPLNFTGVSNITIRGQGYQYTHISCKHTNAGLVFNNSSHIELTDFTIDSCGFTNTSEENYLTGNASKSISIATTKNVQLQRLSITNSHGYGLLITNSFGSVLLNNLTFANNRVNEPELEYTSGGGGVFILFNMSYGQQRASYNISNCKFDSNSANVQLQAKRHDFAEKGGGMHLHFLHSSYNIQINVHSCNFTNNTAIYGGGLYVKVSDQSTECNVTVSKSSFLGNQAKLNGGGADFGFGPSLDWNFFSKKNLILFDSVLFQDNFALIGGAASVFTSSVVIDEINSIKIFSCNFIHNSAIEGAAMYIKPAFTMESKMISITLGLQVTIGNVVFLQNFLQIATEEYTENGVLMTTEVTVIFQEMITFVNNSATALYAASALLKFDPYSTITFLSNSGVKGGAVLLAEESRMQIENNTHFEFVNNSASYGGAICALHDHAYHVSTYTVSCFFYSVNSLQKNFQNITLKFDENRAFNGIGNNIFATSLAPCLEQCRYNAYKNLVTKDIFTIDCIGNVSFEQGIYNSSIATAPLEIDCVSCICQPIPGFPFHLNITLIDEMGNDVKDMYILIAKLQNSSSKVSLAHPIIVQNSVTLHGKPGESGEIVIIENSTPIIRKHSLKFTLANCPPGFTVQDGSTCTCSELNKTSRYFGIPSCRSNAALITLGHWVGYIGNESEDTLFTAICINTFCNFSYQQPTHGQHLLPSTAISKEDLENAVCGDSRRGVLCSYCAEDFTLVYHSRILECRNKSLVNCSYGVPLYIISALVPVTVLFLVILIFNIKLTSGALCSFVFYAQMLDSQAVDAFGTTKASSTFAKYILNVFSIVYGLFNLNMLNIDGLSFCLISDANAMDLFMFHYGTTLYAVLLVIVTVLVLRLHSCYCCVKLGRRCGRRNIRGSIVDGLSAFLVLCYFQCTKTTFQILTPATLRGKGEAALKTVPLFLGDTEYFQMGHLPYAIPAIICLFIVVIPPPFILIFEPVLTKLFGLQIWSIYIMNLYTKIRMKLMPFLDSFQSSFKDDYRFFAGLYFAYRAAVTATFFTQKIFSCIAAVEIILFLMTFTHVVFRPHKKLWHNVLELGIFLDLLFVNTVSLLNYAAVIWGNADSVSSLVWLQTIAVLLPTLYLVVYITVAAYQYLKACHRNPYSTVLNPQTSEALSNAQESMGFPARLLD